MMTKAEEKSMNDWIATKWMGKEVIQAKGSADCIGRTGKVEETFFDEKGALHCRIVKNSAHGMTHEFWCPAINLYIPPTEAEIKAALDFGKTVDQHLI